MRAMTFLLLGVCLLLSATNASAVVVPYVEDFTTTAGWVDNASAAVTLVPAGGPDGSSFISADYAQTIGATDVILFRGNVANNASNGAFAGNWIAAGVDTFSFKVRHNGVAPLTFFTRLPAAGATGIMIDTTVVAPNVWQEISFPISPSNPFIVYEGPPAFNTVFSSIGNIQVGASFGDSYPTSTVTFDLDQVTVVPEPGTFALMGMGCFAFGVVMLRRKRRTESMIRG